MTHFSFSSGLINIPAVALGIFSGGIVMKKFRISIRGAAKLYLGSSVLGYLLFLSLFALGCENSDVAGLTISYQGYVYSLSNQRRSVCLIKLIIMFQNKIIKSLRIIPMKRNYCFIVEEWTMLITWKLLLSPKSVISFESESGSKYLKRPNPHLSLGKQSDSRKYRP